MIRFFETILRPTGPPPPGQPPAGLGAFYWHFVRQSRGLVVALFAAGMLTAVLDSLIPVFIGRVVNLVGTQQAATLWTEHGDSLLGMAAVLLLARPAALTLQYLITNQAIAPGMTNLVRWQSHWHVVRQSWAFFQNDFAGRIANRVSQVGPSLRGKRRFRHQCRLVHRRLWRQRDPADGPRRLLARRAVAAVVLRICRHAARLRAAAARAARGGCRRCVRP